MNSDYSREMSTKTKTEAKVAALKGQEGILICYDQTSIAEDNSAEDKVLEYLKRVLHTIIHLFQDVFITIADEPPIWSS